MRRVLDAPKKSFLNSETSEDLSFAKTMNSGYMLPRTMRLNNASQLRTTSAEVEKRRPDDRTRTRESQSAQTNEQERTREPPTPLSLGQLLPKKAAVEPRTMDQSSVQLAAAAFVCTTVALVTFGSLALRPVGPTAAARSSLKAKLAKELAKITESGKSKKADGIGALGVLDVRRKLQIAKGGASDHAGEVIVVALPGFDINKTIFGTVEGFIPRTVIKSKIGVELFWSDFAVSRANAAYALVPQPPSYKSSIIKFMSEECDLKMEHADGSFMDHLRFCHEYSAQHYKGKSPIPLFLHSIMGVGTNFFPMVSPTRHNPTRHHQPY